MQIDADPEEGIAGDQQHVPEADFIVENPTLVSNVKTFVHVTAHCTDILYTRFPLSLLQVQICPKICGV